MIEDKLSEYIEKADLTKNFQSVVDLCGIETALQLIRNMGGEWIYVPDVRHNHTVKMKYIRMNYENKSVYKIALELGMSIRAVRRAIKRIRERDC